MRDSCLSSWGCLGLLPSQVSSFHPNSFIFLAPLLIGRPRRKYVHTLLSLLLSQLVLRILLQDSLNKNRNVDHSLEKVFVHDENEHCAPE